MEYPKFSQILDEAAENKHNEVKAVTTMRGDDDLLPEYGWPEGYPLFYIDMAYNILCPACANRNDEYNEPLIGYDVNEKDTTLCCFHCGGRIKSAKEI